MGTIAAAAFASWCGVMWLRSAEFAARAGEHQASLLFNSSNLSMKYYLYTRFERQPVRPLVRPARDELERLEGRWTYHRRMYEKYRRLSLFPWFSAGPDPAAPP